MLLCFEGLGTTLEEIGGDETDLDVQLKAATISEKAKKAKKKFLHRRKCRIWRGWNDKYSIEVETVFADVATKKPDLQAIRAEVTDMRASHAVISKNLEDIVIQQEDKIIRLESVSKQQTKYIGRLVVCVSKGKAMIKPIS